MAQICHSVLGIDISEEKVASGARLLATRTGTITDDAIRTAEAQVRRARG